MQKLKNTQLIVSKEGAIYHLNLKPENIADTIVIVGDPGRVPMISKYFDQIEFKGQNREINTHTGRIGDKKLTVLSSGMGPDNIDIVLNELDALVNIDLQEKTIKPEHKTLNIIRLGTSGAVQKDIEVDSFVMSKYGFGLDGLMNFYKPPESVFEREMEQAILEQLDWPKQFADPYIVKCSENLASQLGFGMHQGITVTAPGFYGPQGRTLRMKLNFPDFNEKLEFFHYKNERILNFEMETSALYGLGKSLGHNVLTICAIIANRVTEAYSADPPKTINKLINVLLERLTI